MDLQLVGVTWSGKECEIDFPEFDAGSAYSYAKTELIDHGRFGRFMKINLIKNGVVVDSVKTSDFISSSIIKELTHG